MNIEQVPPRYRNRLRVDSNGCWIWTGAKGETGYGKIGFCGRNLKAHRLFFELLVGPIPEGFEIHHSCQAKACCNPDHLTILSQVDHRFHHRHTHCLRGHPLTPDNTVLRTDGGRQCRQCRDESKRRWEQKQKEQHHGVR